jgi:hypothetical protein
MVLARSESRWSLGEIIMTTIATANALVASPGLRPAPVNNSSQTIRVIDPAMCKDMWCPINVPPMRGPLLKWHATDAELQQNLDTVQADLSEAQSKLFQANCQLMMASGPIAKMAARREVAVCKQEIKADTYALAKATLALDGRKVENAQAAVDTAEMVLANASNPIMRAFAAKRLATANQNLTAAEAARDESLERVEQLQAAEDFNPGIIFPTDPIGDPGFSPPIRRPIDPGFSLPAPRDIDPGFTRPAPRDIDPGFTRPAPRDFDPDFNLSLERSIDPAIVAPFNKNIDPAFTLAAGPSIDPGISTRVHSTMPDQSDAVA